MTQPKRNYKLAEEMVQKNLAAYARTRDAAIRDEIVMQYDNLVESIARKFTGAGEPIEDLAQEGYIGLITAVDLYDATKGVKFSTYATHFVIGQIKHYLRDKGKIIKEPAWLQELNQRMTRVIDSLTQKHGRPPFESEIAEVMDMPEETVAEMLTTREVFKVSSLDAGTEREDGSGYPSDAEKIVDQKCQSFQLPLEDKIVLETAMDRLKDIEQKVVQEFFFKDLNQTEIARKLGISCNYVSHILRNSTKKLKKILMTDEIRDKQIQVSQMSRRATDVGNTFEPASVVDQLTGIYNRRYFAERLDEEVSRACRHGHTLSIVLMKIDLPESVGQLTRLIRSDDVIQMASERLRSSVRKADVVARFSDSVFGIILPHADANTASIANRISSSLTSEPFKLPHSRETISVEVDAVWSSYPAQCDSAQELIDTAIKDLGVTLEESTSISNAA